MPNNDSDKLPAWINKLIPIAVIIFGIALLSFGSQELIQGYLSKTWQVTTGEIIESNMLWTGSETKGHKPEIVYVYEVDGTQFFSDRILFGISSYRTFFKSSRQVASEWLEKYPVGRKVSVAYDVKDPSRSTLNTGIHLSALLAPIMGILYLIFSLLVYKKFNFPDKQ